MMFYGDLSVWECGTHIPSLEWRLWKPGKRRLSSKGSCGGIRESRGISSTERKNLEDKVKLTLFLEAAKMIKPPDLAQRKK